MGIKYNSFAIRGIDVSSHNGTIDWDKASCNFAGIRVGYGKTLDTKFLSNWQNAKGKVNRMPYWYLDYYSNWYNKTSSVYGMADADWGKAQADYCWSLYKTDPEGIIFLDIENGGSSYSKPLTTDADSKKHAQIIARAFLERMDILNEKTNGIYCSVGLLTWFGTWFKDRPLWAAWYNKNKTTAQVIKTVKNYGWTGKVFIWQYASDGDINGDGIKAGKTYFKTQLDEMDLNGWVGTVSQYEQMFSTSVEIPDPIETPDDEAEVIPVANTRVIEVKTATRTLTLRKKPQVSWLTQIRTYPAETKFDCLEKVTVDGNTWQRVGIDQYVADTHNGIQYLK
jgi:GH25 family lysozyme M1 (1,4-beta-N-acetylmuramidase)